MQSMYYAMQLDVLVHVLVLMQVDLMMLDLDVGFILDPMRFIRKLRYSRSDVFVQVCDQ